MMYVLVCFLVCFLMCIFWCVFWYIFLFVKKTFAGPRYADTDSELVQYCPHTEALHEEEDGVGAFVSFGAALRHATESVRVNEGVQPERASKLAIFWRTARAGERSIGDTMYGEV
jgi:hypothetical protein